MDRHTHYLPYFTTRDAEGRQRAACSAFVTPDQIAQPGDAITCWGCHAYCTTGPGTWPATYYCERCGRELHHPPATGLCSVCELNSEPMHAAAVALEA